MRLVHILNKQRFSAFLNDLAVDSANEDSIEDSKSPQNSFPILMIRFFTAGNKEKILWI